jgi:hypothetical protein
MENSRKGDILPSLAQRGILLMMAGASVWFFLQLWQNVSVLSSRTLPGVAYAADLIDRASQMEFARLEGIAAPGIQNGFEQVLLSYESTIAVEQDRANYDSVRRAYDSYLSERNHEAWGPLARRGQDSALFPTPTRAKFRERLASALHCGTRRERRRTFDLCRAFRRVRDRVCT